LHSLKNQLAHPIYIYQPQNSWLADKQEATEISMIDSTIFRAVQGVAKLSGSFAFSGLVAQYGNGKAHQAFAFTDPVYYQLRDVTYPVRRPSGKVVQDLRSKRPDVVRLLCC